jgi:hypothetical protein
MGRQSRPRNSLSRQKGEHKAREGEVGDAEKHFTVAAVGIAIPTAVSKVGDFLRQESQMNRKCHINAVIVTIGV